MRCAHCNKPIRKWTTTVWVHDKPTHKPRLSGEEAHFGRLAKLANGHLWLSLGRDAQATTAIIYLSTPVHPMLLACFSTAGQFETETRNYETLLKFDVPSNDLKSNIQVSVICLVV
jgi:hypothetical protein